MHLNKIMSILLAGLIALTPLHSMAVAKKTVKTTKVVQKAQHKASKSSKTAVKKHFSKARTKTVTHKKLEKNETQRLYGVKGAKLQPTKVSDKRYRYIEKGKTHTTIGKEASRQYEQVGIASYYAGEFHGRRTANGEIFDKNAYTAAHKTLALGSYALVTNLSNGRKVVVKINDRGPFSKSRIIDVSKGAARELGMIRSGTARVRVEAIQVDKQGYISGKGVNALQALAKKDGLPLKTKGKGKDFAIKADESASVKNKAIFTVKVITKTEKEAKNVVSQIKQKAQIKKQGQAYEVLISVADSTESNKVKTQLQKLNHHQIITYLEK